jgi:hypothetical protein
VPQYRLDTVNESKSIQDGHRKAILELAVP